MNAFNRCSFLAGRSQSPHPSIVSCNAKVRRLQIGSNFLLMARRSLPLAKAISGQSHKKIPPRSQASLRRNAFRPTLIAAKASLRSCHPLKVIVFFEFRIEALKNCSISFFKDLGMPSAASRSSSASSL